ncbi:hypothetical protein K469DRAFT_707996 [Zopfia rhizophila CBS 207.26]|uniref:Uncharacterized protein n=1 Tax=Zopfia rhizophila CBS 207.26 TaxID=1314779 RepID=A0A6A6E071_9PEZI|nr:hypothetical protein K469DRAFT_707996 [Zopfia rhizophila CBS 207.26]
MIACSSSLWAVGARSPRDENFHRRADRTTTTSPNCLRLDAIIHLGRLIKGN